jgi:hypothetical protein
MTIVREGDGQSSGRVRFEPPRREPFFVHESKPKAITMTNITPRSDIHPYSPTQSAPAPVRVEYKPFLDALFEGADVLMWSLSEEKDYFTNYEVLRRSAQQHQAAYVNFLKTVLDHRGEAYLFNIAHENIGSRLRDEAMKLGYRQEKQAGVREVNIWGDDTPAVVYHRTASVCPPY